MLFNSYHFIFAFLPIMLLGYFWLTRKRLILGSKLWLIGGSLFFYSYWDIYYLPLLLLSIVINFFIGSVIAKEGQKFLSKKQLLILGIIFNIAILAFYKYTDFFIVNLNAIGTHFELLHIILPLGVSFFTFTQIAFLVDAYKGKVQEYDFLNYMLFVSYFPHLLAGPILHHSEMMPQFASKWNFALRWRNVAVGLFLFAMGLFKKVVIADTFAPWANAGFDVATTLNFFEAWATSLSYTLQLYFDFSGYTDMAIGVSLMFNIRLPLNFNSPYKAKDIQDFWRRWHMTLSRFLRDYIYIPLGGNRVGRYKNYLNLFTVFVVGGFWHGAAWTFIAWGALHGIAIVIHRVWKDTGLQMWAWLGWFITFNFVNVTWVFFRAKDFESVGKVLGGMVGFGGVVLPIRLSTKLAFLSEYDISFTDKFIPNISMSSLFIVFIIIWLKNSELIAKRIQFTWLYALYISLLLILGSIFCARESQFLYFQF